MTVLPPSGMFLGAKVVAEHPSGQRLTGEVRGCGGRGVVLYAPPLSSLFLAYDEGWTVELDTLPEQTT